MKIHPPLAQFPSDKLMTLAPLLRTADFAVLESDARGWEKQVTTILYAKASPEAVREVVIHPERYQDFVRNMTGRSVSKHNADGTFDHNLKLSYTVAGFSGVNRYTELPAAEGEAAGEVEITDPTGMSHYRWQFLPASNGGGTIVVVYGYTDMRHSGGFIDKVLARAETLEHGLAIITQLTLHRAMVAQAEKHPGTFPPYVPPATGSAATSYRFLLDRGAPRGLAPPGTGGSSSSVSPTASTRRPRPCSTSSATPSAGRTCRPTRRSHRTRRRMASRSSRSSSPCRS